METAAESRPAAPPLMEVAVEPPITLGRFLKLAGFAPTGGEAKALIAAGGVRVNGVVETRRGRKLWLGDAVESQGCVMQVAQNARPGQ